MSATLTTSWYEERRTCRGAKRGQSVVKGGVVGVEGRNRIVSYLLEDAGVYLRIKRINASYLYGVLRLWLKAQANSTHGLSRGQIKVIPLHLAG